MATLHEPSLSPALECGKLIRVYCMLLSIKERVEDDPSLVSITDLAIEQLEIIMPSLKPRPGQERTRLLPWCHKEYTSGVGALSTELSHVEEDVFDTNKIYKVADLNLPYDLPKVI